MYLTAMINSEIYSYDDENQAIDALRAHLLEQLAEDEQDVERYDLKLTKVQHGMVMNAELK
jgi:aspartyl aminopeptidase